jgi:hypothetical protein
MAQQSGFPPTGRFLWLRRELVGAVGGCVYHETPVLVQMGDAPTVWFNRDESGHALLNVRMLTTAGNEAERIRIEDNDFSLRGNPIDFECPPSGRLLRVRYANGDYMRVAFREVRTPEAAQRAFPHISSGSFDWLQAVWPLTFVMISMHAGWYDRPVRADDDDAAREQHDSRGHDVALWCRCSVWVNPVEV